MKFARMVSVWTIALGLAMVGSGVSAAPSPLLLSVNGKLIQSESPPILANNSVLVPLRTVSDALGAKLEWNSNNQTAILRKWSSSVSLSEGNRTASISRWQLAPETLKLDVSPKLANGRLYVPIRFLSETFGYVVYYSGGTVFVRDPISPAQQQTLLSGPLEEARKLAIVLVPWKMRSEPEPLKPTHWSEYYGDCYLIPATQSKGLLYFTDDLVSWVELRDGFMVATWQARVKDEDGVNLFLQGKWTEERGTKPDLTGQTFYYYTKGFWGDSNEQSSGYIDSEGKLTVTAHVHYVAGSYVYKETIEYALPGETRDESYDLKEALADTDSYFKPGMTILFPPGKDADQEAVLQLTKKSAEAIAAKDTDALHATVQNGGDYLDFFITSGWEYRFRTLDDITGYDPDTGRYNIVIGYEAKVPNGEIRKGEYTFTSLKGKDGLWKIATID